MNWSDERWRRRGRICFVFDRWKRCPIIIENQRTDLYTHAFSFSVFNGFIWQTAADFLLLSLVFFDCDSERANECRILSPYPLLPFSCLTFLERRYIYLFVCRSIDALNSQLLTTSSIDRVSNTHIQMALGPSVPTTAFVVVYNPSQVRISNPFASILIRSLLSI